MIQKHYRSKTNNNCYICNSEVGDYWYGVSGFKSADIMDYWRGIGAKVCLVELETANILPPCYPDELHIDDIELVENLASRIGGIIRFERAHFNRSLSKAMKTGEKFDMSKFQFPVSVLTNGEFE